MDQDLGSRLTLVVYELALGGSISGSWANVYTFGTISRSGPEAGGRRNPSRVDASVVAPSVE